MQVRLCAILRVDRKLSRLLQNAFQSFTKAELGSRRHIWRGAVPSLGDDVVQVQVEAQAARELLA